MHCGPYTGDCDKQCLLELVRIRAYQLCQSRDHRYGHDLDDWLEAEHEVKLQLGPESLSGKENLSEAF